MGVGSSGSASYQETKMGMLNFIKEARQKLFGMNQAKEAESESNYYAGVSGDMLSKVAKVEYDPNRYCLRATQTTGTLPPNSPSK